MATLYLIGVPIGNLEDLSFRALRTLQEVDFIACEDTRHSQRLLNHYGVHKPLVPCHAHNEAKAVHGLVGRLEEGKNGAFISDAGTPGVSDPGGRLAAAVAAAGHVVCPIPGPSALTSLLSVLGLPGKSVLFEGFLSPKGGRRRRQLESMLRRCHIGVVYESPFRIKALMDDLATLAPETPVVLGRELTKVHEEVIRGSAASVATDLGSRPRIKGEFVVGFGGWLDTDKEDEPAETAPDEGEADDPEA